MNGLYPSTHAFRRVALLCLMLACSSARAGVDFGGIYDEVEVKEFLIAGIRTLPISRISETEWLLQLPKDAPESIPRRWKQVSQSDVARVFRDGVAVGQIECIAPPPPSPMVLFCKVPTDSELAFRENGFSWSPFVSTTGFLLAFPSPAGIHSVDFRRRE